MVTLLYAQGLPKLQGGSFCTSRIAQTLFYASRPRRCPDCREATFVRQRIAQTAGRQTLCASRPRRYPNYRETNFVRQRNAQTARRQTLYASRPRRCPNCSEENFVRPPKWAPPQFVGLPTLQGGKLCTPKNCPNIREANFVRQPPDKLLKLQDKLCSPKDCPRCSEANFVRQPKWAPPLCKPDA